MLAGAEEELQAGLESLIHNERNGYAARGIL
jgi:hypothetical protein